MYSIVDDLRRQVRMIKAGRVFRLEDLRYPAGSESHVRQTLARWVKNGRLMRLQRGCYYRPQQSLIGSLAPVQEEAVRDLLGPTEAPTGYITGHLIYVRYELTTTLPDVIEIGTNTPRTPLRRGRWTVRFVEQPNAIEAADVPLLQLLDCLRYIRRVPDALPAFSVGRLSEAIGNLSGQERRRLVKLAMAYPPMTRALLGAILHKFHGVFSKALHRSLPAGRYYEVGLPLHMLTCRPSWRVK